MNAYDPARSIQYLVGRLARRGGYGERSEIDWDGFPCLPNQFAYVFDVNCREITSVHPNIKRVLGYEPAGFTMSKALHLIHPKDLPRILASIQDGFRESLGSSVRKNFEIYHGVRYRLCHSDGAYLPFLRQSTNLTTSQDGDILQYLSICSDLSQAERPYAGSLSQRAKEILIMLGQGYSYAEMAHRLHISENTIRYHIKRLYAELGVHSRAEAVAWVNNRFV